MKKVLLAMASLLAVVPGAMATPVGGGVCRVSTVWSHSTETFDVVLYGGEVSYITVQGDGSTDLDLFVLDENGNLIAQDTSYSGNCSVWVRPYWTGRFTVRVVNRGSVYNQFRICAT
jgi:hypothetical protein